MLVYGRITLFGEYLMHSMTEGYVMPTKYALATPDEYLLPVHAGYQSALDRVRMHLADAGLPTCTGVRGSLPLGHGFASSTALTVLHLGARSQEYSEDIVHRVDEAIHGFTPSGVDYWSITAGSTGYFGPAGWRGDPDSCRPAVSALLVPEPARADLADTRDRVTRAADRLVPIARHLCAALRSRNVLDYRALLDYAICLRRLGVYLPRGTAIIDDVLNRGLAAKGVGGLTNKAVIIVWRPGTPLSEQESVLAELQQYSPDEILPRI